MSDPFSRFIQFEIDKINTHLPAKVVNLRQALTMDKPGVTLRDGFFQEFDVEEMEYVKGIIPRTYWGHVLLPIIITRRRDMGTSEYIVGGSEQNMYIIKSILGEVPIYDVWRLNSEKDHIVYKYDLKKIRKKLSTTSVVAFS